MGGISYDPSGSTPRVAVLTWTKTRVETLVTRRLHPDPADARSPLLRAFRTSGT